MSMSIRPFNTLSIPEMAQLLDNPAFQEYLEFAYEMYVRQRILPVATIGAFAVRGPLAPVVIPRDNRPFGG
jgi:hypothetical protein